MSELGVRTIKLVLGTKWYRKKGIIGNTSATLSAMIGQKFVLNSSTFPHDKNEIVIEQHFPSLRLEKNL